MNCFYNPKENSSFRLFIGSLNVLEDTNGCPQTVGEKWRIKSLRSVHLMLEKKSCLTLVFLAMLKSVVQNSRLFYFLQAGALRALGTAGFFQALHCLVFVIKQTVTGK